jgi:hypothetical protein
MASDEGSEGRRLRGRAVADYVFDNAFEPARRPTAGRR